MRLVPEVEHEMNRTRVSIVSFVSIFVGACIVSAWAVGPCLPAAHAKEGKVPSPATTSESGGKFVQDFYDWYNKINPADQSSPTLESAIEKKPNAFSTDLLTLIKADIAAQDKVEGEIVGLDFDPILATNSDNADKYVIGKVIPKGKTQWVEVYSIFSGKKSEKPIAIPEIEYKNKHWMFVNFHYGKTEYPENENLISVLKALADSRKENPAEANGSAAPVKKPASKATHTK
jgi:hypothetical protein